MNTLNTLVNATLAVEKIRVRTQVRQTHLSLQDKNDPETDELLIKLQDLEKHIDGRIAIILTSHPAYDWFSRVKGIGKENIAKVVGMVDIEKANTISSLWKFAGFSVEDGKAPKRVKGGGKLSYNSQLRSMCWRLGSSLLRAKGVFYEYYLQQKDRYMQRFENEGVKVAPTTSLPKVGGKRTETEGYISEGHVHNMALRKMIKLFLACLWLKWRESAGLPITEPYAIGVLKHDSMIDPENMVDK